jgi:hypothetical protein
MTIDREASAAYIQAHVAKLGSSDGAQQIEPTQQWRKGFRDEPGVYAIFLDGKIIYCGETASLRGRMGDLTRTLNHTFRRKFGHDKFSTHEQYLKAGSKRKFPDAIEKLLDEEMCKLSVKTMPVVIGRREIEEAIVQAYAPIYNRSQQRGKSIRESPEEPLVALS